MLTGKWDSLMCFSNCSICAQNHRGHQVCRNAKSFKTFAFVLIMLSAVPKAKEIWPQLQGCRCSSRSEVVALGSETADAFK